MANELKACEWFYEGVAAGDYYRTTCGNYFQVFEGTPADNNMHFCCYCGGELIQAEADADSVEEA